MIMLSSLDAIPPDILHELRHLHFPLEIPDISIIAKAAQIRLIATPATYNLAITMVD